MTISRLCRDRGGVDPARVEGRVVPTVGMQLRDVDATHRWLEGRAVPYGTAQDIGWFTEQFDAGAFKKSIREAANGLPLMLFHNSSSLDHLIGRAHEWHEKDDGLHGVWSLAEHDTAQRAAKMVAEGLLGYMSIGFMPIRSTTAFVEQNDGSEKVVITRHEARLLEVSLTPTPAYQDAAVTKVRTAETSLHADVAGREIAGWAEWLSTVQSRSH